VTLRGILVCLFCFPESCKATGAIMLCAYHQVATLQGAGPWLSRGLLSCNIWLDCYKHPYTLGHLQVQIREGGQCIQNASVEAAISQAAGEGGWEISNLLYRPTRLKFCIFMCSHHRVVYLCRHVRLHGAKVVCGPSAADQMNWMP
jgi:hypothetical protein